MIPSMDGLASRLTKSGGSQDLFNSPGQDRYLDLIENSDEIVYTHDLEGNFTSVSRAIQPTTGYSREEVLRMNLSDLLAPESVGLSRRMVEQKLGSGSPTTYEVAVRRKDGRRVALEVTSRLLFQMGRPTGVLCLVRESNRLQPSDSTLRLLRSVVVNANDAVLIALAKPADQLGGKIIYVNEAFCRMTGYSAEEAVGRTPRILLGPQSDRDHLDQVRQALSRLEPVRVELVNYRKDGSAYWVDVNFVPIMDEKDEFTHWVAVQRETTHRRRAEDLERDRNRVLELVARNEPLDVVLTQLAQMMERQCPDLQCSVLLLRNGQLMPEAGAKLSGDALRAFQELNDGDRPAGPRLDIYREMLPGPQLGATWSVPILSGSGVVLGAFAISCGVSRKPAEEELGAHWQGEPSGRHRDRAEATHRQTGAPGPPRHADRPAQPRPLRGAPSECRGPGADAGLARGGAVRGSGPLQAGQRHPRTSGRRCPAATGGAAAGRTASGRRTRWRGWAETSSQSCSPNCAIPSIRSRWRRSSWTR